MDESPTEEASSRPSGDESAADLSDEGPADDRAGDGFPGRPSVDGSAADPAGQSEFPMTFADEFLAAATREYEEGHVDQTLWARALSQSGDDESLAIAAYLRARATQLRLQKRDRRRARRARRAKAAHEATSRNVETNSQAEVPPAAVGVRLGGLQAKPKYLAAAAAVVTIAVAAVWLTASPPMRESAAPLRASASAKSAERAPSTVPVGNSHSVAPRPSGVDAQGSIPSVSATVQQLKDAGNWNVLVFYAAKWTRDEPNNPAGWKELSIGYANLHQFDDAVVAAGKAAELSPGDALLWRNLGHLNVALDRLPEAEWAFDKALAISSDNADALCGAALVAHKLGRPKDAADIAKRVDPGFGRCPGLDDGESVTVVVRPAAPVKSASKGRH